MRYILIILFLFSTSAFAYDPIYDWALREANKEQPFLPPDLMYNQIQDDLQQQQFQHEMEHLEQEAYDDLNRDYDYGYDY